MPLGSDYAGQTCSMARALEIVGERWTLLIVRDLLLGVRRFNALQRRLDIPRAMLAARLATLEEHGIVERNERRELQLTQRGRDLWPAVHALMQWGEQHCTEHGPRRLFLHAECGTGLDASGRLPRLRPRARAARDRDATGARGRAPSATTPSA